MELVKGVPITEYCDHGQAPIRERLELFLDVCQAVQHAHQKGIIHRDVKPSNVLISMHDTTPAVKVIDFGIAKAIGQQLTDKTLFTGFAQMIGTPLYMSPEQAGMSDLDVDTRSDIYSLGVLLYELLTGTTPFDEKRFREAGFDEMRRIIREEEPPKPSTRLSTLGQASATASTNRKSDPKRLSRLFRGELDWIVMKALEKDRNRRYETASAFAADVQRYLNDEAVLACPPSAWYRFGKFARRHRTVLLTSTLVAVALLAGAIIATWQAVLAGQAREQTQAELAEKKKQYQRAEANFLKVLEAVDQLLTEVGQKELTSIPHLDHVRRRLLEKALAFFEAFLRDRGDNPDVRFEASLAYRRVGDIRGLLGQHNPGREACDRAVALLEELRAEQPERPSYRQELARACSSRAIRLATLGQRQAAEQDCRRAHALLADLAAEDPDQPEYRADLGLICHRWGEFLTSGESRQDAEQLFREGAGLLEELARRFPDRLDYLTGLVKCCGSLANLLTDTNRPNEADDAFRRAFAAVGRARQRPGAGPDVQWLDLLLHVNHGNFLWRRGQVAAAEKSYRKAIEEGEQLAARFPAVPKYRHELAGAGLNLGTLLMKNRQNAAASKTLKSVLTVAEKLAADFSTVAAYHRTAGSALNNLAVLLLREGRPAEARPLLEKALERQQAAHDHDPKDRRTRDSVCNLAANLAILLQQLRAPADEVDRAHERSVALSRALATDYPDVAEYQSGLGCALSNRAGLLADRGQRDKALPLVEEAVVRQQAALKVYPRNPMYLEFLKNHYALQAEVLDGLGRPEAEGAYRAAVTTAERQVAVSPNRALGELARQEDQLARWLERHGKQEEARRFRAEAKRRRQEADRAADKPAKPPAPSSSR
jgi:tetratricopeptide (TPR) repeat protein